MTNLVIDRRTNRLWKSFVVERRRNSFLYVNDVIVANLIEFIGGYAYLYIRRNHLKHVRGKLADLHKLEQELRTALRACKKELRRRTARCPLLSESVTRKPENVK